LSEKRTGKEATDWKKFCDKGFQETSK